MRISSQGNSKGKRLEQIDKRLRKTPTGRWITAGLFVELNQTDLYPAIWTLEDYDIVKNDVSYPSLYLLYMDMEDLTEFEFANRYFGSYEHWEALCKQPTFKPYAERWRKELALKIQARALRQLADEAQSESKNSYSANKFLVEKGWIPKEGSGRGRGRPSKKEIEEAAKLEASQKNQILDDYERLQEFMVTKDLN